MKSPKKILITGSAGFIGFHLASNLIKQNKEVINIDNLNNYYDVKLKKDRINKLKSLSHKKKKKYFFYKLNI